MEEERGGDPNRRRKSGMGDPNGRRRGGGGR